MSLDPIFETNIEVICTHMHRWTKQLSTLSDFSHSLSWRSESTHWLLTTINAARSFEFLSEKGKAAQIKHCSDKTENVDNPGKASTNTFNKAMRKWKKWLTSNTENLFDY